MNRYSIMSNNGCRSEEAKQLRMVHELQPHVNNRQVLEGLCAMAVSPVRAKVREAILMILQPVAESANQWFARAARLSDNRLRRRLALVNLSLMECTVPEARQVVLQGLADPDHEIQRAAALSAGLFNDREFLAAVDLFLERNRFSIAMTDLPCTTFQTSQRSDYEKEPYNV